MSVRERGVSEKILKNGRKRKSEIKKNDRIYSERQWGLGIECDSGARAVCDPVYD